MHESVRDFYLFAAEHRVFYIILNLLSTKGVACALAFKGKYFSNVSTRRVCFGTLHLFGVFIYFYYTQCMHVCVWARSAVEYITFCLPPIRVSFGWGSFYPHREGMISPKTAALQRVHFPKKVIIDPVKTDIVYFGPGIFSSPYAKHRGGGDMRNGNFSIVVLNFLFARYRWRLPGRIR